MSTARRRLKSPQSLNGSFTTHPTMVTHRSWSWPWMIDSHPFRSMSISAPPPSNKAISYSVMGEFKGKGHIVHPVFNRCTSFSFHINRANHSWDMSNREFDLEKNTSEIFKENLAKIFFNRIPPKSNQVISMIRGILRLSFVVIGWVVLTSSCRQANFVYLCHSRDLGSRSPKGHAVHFLRPILSLSQICKL